MSAVFLLSSIAGEMEMEPQLDLATTDEQQLPRSFQDFAEKFSTTGENMNFSGPGGFRSVKCA